MAYAIGPLIGVDLANGMPASILPTNSAGVAIAPWAVGTETFGNDGKLYVFAKAGGAIPASTAVCSVNASTFSATGAAGAYTSPATPAAGLATGDYGWFSKPSV